MDFKTLSIRAVLAALGASGMDRVFQQIDSALGVILTFHDVAPDTQDPFAPNRHLTIAPEFLSKCIQLLKSRDYELVSMDEVYDRVTNSKRDSRFAAITFDDGYRGMLEHAIPVMREEKTPYALYIAPGLVDGTANLWWLGIERLVRENDGVELYGRKYDCSTLEQKQAVCREIEKILTTCVPERELQPMVEEVCGLYNIDLEETRSRSIIGWDEINSLHADPLATIGAHGVDHLALARLSAVESRDELSRSADILEDRLGKRPRHFAYPYGYKSAAAARDFGLAVEEGFVTGVTTRPGMIFPEHAMHLTALPRISVNGRFQQTKYFGSLTSGLPTRLKQMGRKLDVS